MRRATLLGCCLAVPALLVAAEGLAEALWARDAFENTFYQFVRSEGSLAVPSVPAPLRALAATQRKEAVEALGGRAKAYFASEAFKKRWTQEHGGRYQDADEARRKVESEQARKQGQARADKNLAEAEKMMSMMPPEMQEQMRAKIAKARADQARKEAKRNARQEAAAADQGAQSVPDSKVALRKALQGFLRASEGVDFAAPLVYGGPRATFSNPVYEAKPGAWKACYRAGRQATEAARAYAKAWLAELG